MENIPPIEINRFFGLNSKTSRAKLAPGFSASSEHFYNIDLSVPGVSKVRGGSEMFCDLGESPTRIFNYYKPSTDANVMMVSAGTSVYAVDLVGNPTSIGSGFTDGEIFDFLNYGDDVYYTNGTDEGKVYDGTSQRKWGIVAPTAANTFAADSGTGLSGVYLYRFSYVNSATGGESSASPMSASHTVTNKTINLSGLTASADPQVDKINIYRTTNGGGIFFYLAQINNGTTTYADSITDTNLGTTEAPLYNAPPGLFLGIEEWDGRIFGFLKNSTVVSWSNDEFYTPAGTGLPWESFHPDGNIDFKAKVHGIKKSPNFNELWVHTDNGIYALIRTEVPEVPYRPVVRNSNFYSISHYSIQNIYNSQWYNADEGRIISMDSAGNINYESYQIEPDFASGNKVNFTKNQSVHYHGNKKNQYRLIYPLNGQTNPQVMLAANYLQRTPADELSRTYPTWEYHKINATTVGVCKDSNDQDTLFTGWTDGKIYKQDVGTNDAGVAIDWKMSLGWLRCAQTADRTSIARRIIQYYNPLGNWKWSLQTNFDFGSLGGQIYQVSAVPVGDRLDIDFVLDVSLLSPENPLKKVVTDVYGPFTFAEIVWSGNVVDQIMELHAIVLQPVTVEGFRSSN